MSETNSAPRTPQRRRNRGRGGDSRGGRGGQAAIRPPAGRGGQSPSNLQSHNEDQSPNLGETAIQPHTNGKDPVQKQDGEETDGEVCFICASPVIHIAVAPCNHRTCHICSLRMRALYKNKACAHCRTNWDFIIFTDEERNFEDFADTDVAFTDNTLGIKYEKKEIQEDTLLLLRYNCPDSDCDVACLGWPDLHRHVKAAHHKIMCDLCTRNKKVFTHEHELFTKEELRRHEEAGDDKPGAADQSGFRGHPKCGFCRRHFYSDDELYSHCREQHEKCHICDRRNPGRPQYYLNYDTLEQHFRSDHYLCLDRECLEKKFVVFESEMDLKAHQLEAHPNGLTKDHRRVDLSDFSVRERYQPTHRGRDNHGRGRGRGRGRDPNAEPIPPSSAQPMRRDEVAFQRQMAIRNASPATGRAFGGQLTSTPSAPSSAQSLTAATSNSDSAGHRAEYPSISVASRTTLGRPTTPINPEASAPITREQEIRQMRHQAVIERAANFLNGDQTKLGGFRANISAYKNSTMKAAQLIESFFALFDASSTELGTLIKEIADIFEIASKKEDLLKAWNDWKAINEDYPSLPGSSSQSAAIPKASGKRVLRLKSSTAQSSKSARTASWGSAAAASSRFPLPLPDGLQRPSSKPARQSTTPWGGAQPTSSSSGTLAANKGSIKTVSNNASAFPALPQAAKPSTTAFTPGYNGVAVRRVGNSSAPEAGSAWGSARAGAAIGQSLWVGGATGGAAASQAEADPTGGGGAAKKKGGRKKQTLMHFG